MIEGISSSSTTLSGHLGLSVHSDNQKSKKENANTPIQNNFSKKKNTDETGLRLTPEQKKEVEELKKRDLEVHVHEQAHMTAGKDLASPASYTKIKGPDNKSYATGGEVQINVSEEVNPEKTIEKARKIRSAALAPVNPSSQDMQVASQANQMEAQARIEKNSIKNSENDKNELSEKNTITTKKQDETLPINRIKNSSVNESVDEFLVSSFIFSSVKNTTVNNNIIGDHVPPSQKAVASLYSYNAKLTQETSYSSLSLTL